MIQRLQSVFLLLASGACFGLFGTDAADSDQQLPDSRLFADAEFDVFDNPVFILLFSMAGLIFLADIFLYKNRKLQVNSSKAGILLVALGTGYGVYSFMTDAAAQAPSGISPDLGVGLPVLAIIFAILANKYINADEKLVRSADRLR